MIARQIAWHREDKKRLLTKVTVLITQQMIIKYDLTGWLKYAACPIYWSSFLQPVLKILLLFQGFSVV